MDGIGAKKVPCRYQNACKELSLYKHKPSLSEMKGSLEIDKLLLRHGDRFFLKQTWMVRLAFFETAQKLGRLDEYLPSGKLPPQA
jgi:hypothetical protein